MGLSSLSLIDLVVVLDDCDSVELLSEFLPIFELGSTTRIRYLRPFAVRFVAISNVCCNGVVEGSVVCFVLNASDGICAGRLNFRVPVTQTIHFQAIKSNAHFRSSIEFLPFVFTG